MKTSHEMAQSVLKRQKKILRRRSNILTALGATGGTFAIIAAFALIFSLGRLREAQPVVTVATTNITSAPTSETAPLEEKTDPLSILQYRTNEEGEREIYVNPEEWEKIYDFDLFRKFFFGTWKITEGHSIGILYKDELMPFIIDDSEKSIFATAGDFRLTNGYFYRIGENILAFAINGSAEINLFWLDINCPDSMHSDYFAGNGDGTWIRYDDHSFISLYGKTNSPINEPENGYLSIFRLYEISREYGIDFNMLVNLKYDTEIDGYNENLLHDDWYQFYPIYLISEEADKLILKTTVGNAYHPDVMAHCFLLPFR